jgi:hypothetical protein
MCKRRRVTPPYLTIAINKALENIFYISVIEHFEYMASTLIADGSAAFFYSIDAADLVPHAHPDTQFPLFVGQLMPLALILNAFPPFNSTISKSEIISNSFSVVLNDVAGIIPFSIIVII